MENNQPLTEYQQKEQKTLEFLLDLKHRMDQNTKEVEELLAEVLRKDNENI
jgi:hypothetical protein